MNVLPSARRRRGKVHVPTVTLAHGGGGKAMKDLIDDVFVEAFDNPLLAPLDDQARLSVAALALRGDRLAFTTNSFVVDPLFFPGGDIGKLAVCGTVNDLAVGGAMPLYLSCAAIIEEGVTLDLLRKVAGSMAATAREAGVEIVTGDTKVVNKGACDKLFITTTGVGVIRDSFDLGTQRVQPRRPGPRQRTSWRPRRRHSGGARRHGARDADRERLRAARRVDRSASFSGALDPVHPRSYPRRPGDRAQRDRRSGAMLHRDRRGRNAAARRGARVLRNPGARSSLSR